MNELDKLIDSLLANGHFVEFIYDVTVLKSITVFNISKNHLNVIGAMFNLLGYTDCEIIHEPITDKYQMIVRL